MNDMSPVITPKSDQINADDLISGPMTITIREVQIKGGQEQPVSIYFEGSPKAFRPCKSMSRVLVAAWGPDAKVYIGRAVTLYRDPTVKWGGMEVGGIRISHLSHINGKMQMALTATKGQRKPHIVMPLVMQNKPAGQSATNASNRTAELRAQIDALPDAAAVATWLMDNAGLKDHANQNAREVYAYAESRGRSLSEAAGTSENSETANDDVPADF